MEKGEKTEKANLTRAKIRDAALELFRENSFDKTTMRAIAKRAGVALGSAYYYFKTKDEIVYDYYVETQEEAKEHNEIIVKESIDFKKRFDTLLTFKFDQIKDDRSFASVLTKGAIDRENPLSPFSSETRDIRVAAIQLIEDVIDGSNLKVSKLLRPHVARLLWLFQMGILLYWINDQSDDQSETIKLKDTSLTLMIQLMQMSNLPLMSGLNKTIVQLVKSLEMCTE